MNNPAANEYIDLFKVLSPEIFEQFSESQKEKVVELKLRQGGKVESADQQSSSPYESTQRVFEVVRQGLSSDLVDQEILRNTPIIGLPNDGIEAYTIFEEKKGSHVIIVNFKFLGLCDALARILVLLLSSTAYSDMHVDFGKYAVMHKALPNLVAWARYYCGLSRKSGFRLDVDFSNSDTYQLLFIMTYTMERFIVGHEFAHICLGHLAEHRRQRILIQDKRNEYEADSFALKLLQNEDLNDFTYLALFTMFSFLSVTEVLLNDAGKSLDYHPPALDRLEALRGTGRIHISEEFSPLLNTLRDIFEEIPSIHRYLLKRSEALCARIG